MIIVLATTDSLTGQSYGLLAAEQDDMAASVQAQTPKDRIPQPRAEVGESSSVWPLVHRPEAAGAARRVTRQVLADWHVSDNTTEAVILVVSELVTNAVEHATAPVVLQLHQDTALRVWVGVTDGGPAARDGQWTSSCEADEHGRGLSLVKALTDAHGTRSHQAGTTHWARLPAS
ncbi:ATP-binding protein [Streptomyces sp. NPDC005500]|uniref:ATP-binding protein n=1 Tax=Streptomyces sp. NPDC005500 TaxID=3155007 RepID=UPI0033B5F60A